MRWSSPAPAGGPGVVPPARSPSPLIAFLAVAAVVLAAWLGVADLMRPRGAPATFSADDAVTARADERIQADLRAVFAGRYRSPGGETIVLRESGSYFREGYIPVGSLSWEVRDDGSLFVTTYAFVDFTGAIVIRGLRLDPRGGGRVLVLVDPSGEPMPGVRYLRVERSSSSP